MSPKAKAKVKKRRPITYVWIFGLALLVFLLIRFEQTALLYILSTLGVTVLLVVVAMADLGRSDSSQDANNPEPLSSRNPAR